MLEGNYAGTAGPSSLHVSKTLGERLKLNHLKDRDHLGSTGQKRQEEKVERLQTLGNWTYPWLVVVSPVRWRAGPQGFPLALWHYGSVVWWGLNGIKCVKVYIYICVCAYMCVYIYTYTYTYIIFYLFFRERGKEGEREGEKHQCVVASCAPPGDQACNPGLCPDWE